MSDSTGSNDVNKMSRMDIIVRISREVGFKPNYDTLEKEHLNSIYAYPDRDGGEFHTSPSHMGKGAPPKHEMLSRTVILAANTVQEQSHQRVLEDYFESVQEAEHPLE